MRVVCVTLHDSILPYDRLESVTKSVTKWQLSLALRDDVPLKKIQLMGRIDALCKFDFFLRYVAYFSRFCSKLYVSTILLSDAQRHHASTLCYDC